MNVFSGADPSANRPYAFLFANSPSPVAIADQRGHICWANPAFTLMSGFLEAEAIGQPFTFLRSNLPGPDTAKLLLEAIPPGLGREEQICARRKDGSLHSVHEKIVPFREDVGQARRFVLTWTDVASDRPSALTQRLTEERLLALIAGPDEVVSEIDAQGRFQSIWVKDESLLSRPRDELLGQKVEKYFDPWLGSIMEAHTRRVLQSGKPECIEYSLEVMGGTKWFLGWIAPIPSATGPAETIRFAARDITAIRQTEEQHNDARQLLDVTRLVERIARDFCNVLTVIDGFTELLAAKPAHEQAQQYLSEIRGAWLEADELTRQLRTIGCPSSSECVTVNLNAIIEDLRDTIRHTAGEAATVTVSLDPALGMIAAEPGEMQRMVVGLLTEACDSMPDRGRLSIETENVDLTARLLPTGVKTEQAYIRLVICATGTGPDAGPVASDFADMYSGDLIGVSAGLYAVNEIVKFCGGWISADHRTVTGARIVAYLPQAEERDLAVVQGQQPTGLPAGGDETILVVEGSLALRNLTQVVLAGLGYKVLLAESDEDALQIANGHAGPIDLLVTKLVLEKSSGPELARQLRRSRPEMKVLYTSAHTSRVDSRRPILTTGTTLLAKPYTPGTLAMKIRDVLAAPAPEGLILVVEDEPGVRVLLRHLLSTAGFHIAETNDEHEAMWLVEALRPDLIISDVEMQMCDGIAFMRELRSAHPDVPIIALAGQSHRGCLKVVRKLGVMAALVKPIDCQQLLTTVRDILRNTEDGVSIAVSPDQFGEGGQTGLCGHHEGSSVRMSQRL